MYRRLSGILFPILVVALIGVVVWGYQVNQQKNAVSIQAENAYQRAFHDLSFHMDNVNKELGNAIAVHSDSHLFHRKCLIKTWRITSEAQSQIAQLPLGFMEFEKTKHFLDDLAQFTYRVGIRDTSKQPLNTEEASALETLYKRSGELSEQINGLQAKVLNQNLRWMDVEKLLAGNVKKNSNHVLVDGLTSMNSNVEAYDDVNFGPSMANANRDVSLQLLNGELVNEDIIRKKATEFLQSDDPSAIQISLNGKGTRYEIFHVTAPNPNTDELTEMDYSHKGGKLIWYRENRQVQKKNLTIEQAQEIAVQFLEDHDYPNMTTVSYDEFQNVATLTMSTLKNDIIIFPEKLSVIVALDNGDVTGLQAVDYLMFRKERDIKPAELSSEQARTFLNAKFEVTKEELALINNDLNEEVLCYQFSGSINGKSYRIYVNAKDGYEEKLEQISDI